ncbi:MAG: sugar ABC transporter permease [Anaerolineales bacterium]|nr:sugar ABC transporter permease [Anaerolineales bacterium]
MADQTPTTPPRYPRKRIRWIDVKENLTGVLFILPAFLIISLFGFFPIGYAFYMSLYRWNVRKTGFIGDDNYLKALGSWEGAVIVIAGFALMVLAYWLWTGAFRSRKDWVRYARIAAAAVLVASLFVIGHGWEVMGAAGDKKFLASLPITLYYSIGTVPAELAIALVLAYVLFQKIRGKEFFRMLYFLPYITPVVATAVVFRTIFSPRDSSLANQVLSWFGMEAQKWLFEPRAFNQVFLGLPVDSANWPSFLTGPSMALVTITLFGIWTYVGYNTVIFLAGLGSISQEIYEAGEIDGASKVQLFRYITLPLLSPVTFYLALVAFIGTFKAFNHLYVMRVPSAQGTADVTSIFIFDTFYKANQYGYATAQAIILFLIILALTLAQNKIFGEKVFYE